MVNPGVNSYTKSPENILKNAKYQQTTGNQKNTKTKI